MPRASLLSGLWMALALTPAVAGEMPTPPEGFFALPGAAFEGSSALLPSLAEEPPERALLWSFAELPEGGASLSVGRVELPLTTGPQGRAAVTSAVARHVRGELGLEASVERSTLITGPRGARLEVRAQATIGAGARALRFAFIPAGGRYYVVASSMAQERELELEPRLEAWIDGLQLEEAPRPRPRSSALRAAALGAAGAGAALALRLWLRRARGGGARPRETPEARH
jgi:hypothetical protein